MLNKPRSGKKVKNDESFENFKLNSSVPRVRLKYLETVEMKQSRLYFKETKKPFKYNLNRVRNKSNLPGENSKLDMSVMSNVSVKKKKRNNTLL